MRKKFIRFDVRKVYHPTIVLRTVCTCGPNAKL